MKHCHICLLCNELPFLKQKLPFLFLHFDQIIICDYDILNKSYSTDGSIEYIEDFKLNNDTTNKIILIKDFNPDNVNVYNGVSFIEKRKMFSEMSKYINDDMDLIWATDLDEFFEENLIHYIESLYQNDLSLISVNIPHLAFVYNQFNIFNFKNLYIAPRITKHIKNKIYGHCNFERYGKTLKITNHKLFHYGYVGYNRCKQKNLLYKSSLNLINIYYEALNKGEIHININHPNIKNIKSIPYSENYHPSYIDIETMINELNYIS